MVKILIVDDEKIIREGAAAVIKKCEPDGDLTLCENPKQALEAVKEEPFDIAFLDIEMPGMTGIELAKKIKKLSPTTNIIFCTAYPQYAGEAISLHASGYINKPVTAEKVKAELADLRHPIQEKEEGLRVQAFGNFEVYYNGNPVHFKYSKTKELLAYLVDRSCAVVDSAEIQAVLWEDSDNSNYYKQLRKDLLDTFKEIGQEGAIEAIRGGMGIVPGKIKCDFFEYLSGTPQGINAYHGEYMQQYSWAEVTHGSLEMRKDIVS